MSKKQETSQNANTALLGHSVLDWIGNTNEVVKVPQKANKGHIQASEESPLPEDVEWVRKTYFLRTDHIDQIAEKAFLQKRSQKDILAEALERYLSS
jgi:hypothetical protein